MKQQDKKELAQEQLDKEGNFDFWQDHSLHYLEMAFKTEKRERIESPDGYGKRIGQCGDTVEMFLTIQNNLIKSASFDIDGCMNTMACANTVVLMIEGKTLSQAWELKVDDIIRYLDTLPKSNFHCAELAVGALYLALLNCQENNNSPWKKGYKKY